jgi:RNA polymerase sigma-70 factor (ECF subfamily)
MSSHGATLAAWERWRMRTTDDKALGFLEQQMDRFVDGDSAAFEIIFRRLAPRVAAGLRLMTGSSHLAEDLTQSTFLKVLRARGTYQRGMAVDVWIWAIARRTWIDEKRRFARRLEVPVGNELCQWTSPNDGPETGPLFAALSALPTSQREALLLLKLEGLSAAEAAAVVGTTEGAIKMRAQRGYEQLRRILNSEPDEL